MVNKMILQGRLTKDPELRVTQSGTSVCSFTVAWSETYNGNETKLFLDCVAWRGTGEMVANHFAKGKEIVVEGKLETQVWKDKDGNNRSTIKMTADRVHFCGPKENASSGAYQPADRPVNVGFEELDDDGELPF